MVWNIYKYELFDSILLLFIFFKIWHTIKVIIIQHVDFDKELWKVP